VRAAPLYHAGEYLPRNPLRTRVQSYHEPEMETDPTEQGPFPFLVEAAGIEPAS